MRFIVAATAAALTLLGVQAVPPGLQIASGAVAPPGTLASQTGTPRTLTLITGDQLLITSADGRSMTVLPGKGREAIVFKVEYEYLPWDGKQHMYVTPMDARSLIASGKLDRDLFDVTMLLDSRYDDANRRSLPLIVTYEGTQAQARSAPRLASSVATVTYQLNSVNADAVQAPKRQIAGLWQSLRASSSGVPSSRAQLAAGSGIKKVWLDRLIRPALDQSVPRIGAPSAWNAGYTGTGVVVGVVDTGVDAMHPDLAGKVIAEQNFVAPFEEDTLDHVGHGTHVASTIAGSGAASGGRYRGVAPDAQIVSAKVCFEAGCPTSSVIAGMEWAVTQEGATIVNMSLGGPQYFGDDPMVEAVNRLTAEYNALFVIAAGNSGPDLATVGTPAIAEAALAVAAVDTTDQLASFSSRGPRRRDFGVKPEISAPGVGITAARASNTDLGPPVGEFYTTLNGTSMATPHVAGAAALLKQLHPDWSADQLKAMLIGSAKLLTSPGAKVPGHGAGRVDIAASFTASMLAEPATLSMGIVQWPHNDDALTTQVVTYRNIGTVDQTLALTLNVLAQDGKAAPKGMFALSPATLTVPAGGTAKATVTVDTGIGTDGMYSGRLIAAYDGRTVSTPVSIDREEESYDLTITHIKRDGTPASPEEYGTTFLPLDKQPLYLAEMGRGAGPRGEFTIRLPAGRYSVWSTIQASPPSNEPPPAQSPPLTALIEDIDLRHPLRLTVDAREASPVTLRKPTSTSRQIWTHIGWDMPKNWGVYRFARTEYFSWSFPATNYFSTRGQASPERRELTSWIHGQWVGAKSSPSDLDASRYAGIWVEHGHLPTGPVKVVRPEKSSVVRSTFGPLVPSGADTAFAGVADLVVPHPGQQLGLFYVGMERSIPGSLIEYFYADEPQSVQWASGWSVLNPQPGSPEDLILSRLDAKPRYYRAGQHYSLAWNEPPYGPGFVDGLPQTPARQGDLLTFTAPLYGDRSGHTGTALGNYRTTVYKDGVKRAELDGETVRGLLSPDPAVYRIEVAATQALYGLANPVKAAWTFPTAHVDDNTAVQLPLLSLRFTPALNPKGEAFRGVRFKLPFVVSQLRAESEQDFRCRGGADDDMDSLDEELVDAPMSARHSPAPCWGHVGNVTLDVSFDDGASWKAVHVKREGFRWVADLDHPMRAAYVSLRASATDFSGNSVEQTVIRAYALTDRPKPRPKH
jgi:subtilisin family serine protease